MGCEPAAAESPTKLSTILERPVSLLAYNIKSSAQRIFVDKASFRQMLTPANHWPQLWRVAFYSFHSQNRYVKAKRTAWVTPPFGQSTSFLDGADGKLRTQSPRGIPRKLIRSNSIVAKRHCLQITDWSRRGVVHFLIHPSHLDFQRFVWNQP